MGNCASGQRNKKNDKNHTDDSEPADTSNNNKGRIEDVTYASINHTNGKATRATTSTDNDCDYATVNIPAQIQPDAESEASSKEECADDYVLME